MFGCDELSIPSSELNSTLGRFQHYLLEQRPDPETGMTMADRFKAEFGRDLKVPDMPPLPDQLVSAGEVTILCDEFDGIVMLPDYSRFCRVFRTDRPGREVPDWRDLVWNYIKDPDIPIVAFERMAEHHPQRVEKVLRKLLEDDDFSIEHLYAVVLHYKQPVEGLDDLEDDRRLWDLLNGNQAPKASRPAAKRAKPARSRLARKPVAKKRAPAKKRAAKKAPAIKAPAIKASARAASRARPKAASKSTARAKTPRKSAAKKTATKKR
jgi:hypothetical protein